MRSAVQICLAAPVKYPQCKNSIVGIFHRGIAQLVEQRSPKPRAEGSNPSTPAKDRQCKADGLFVFIYRKISGKQVGQTANTVPPVLCMCCVLLMGLPAGVSLLSHQNTLADAVAVLRYAGSGDNCRGEHCSPASLTKPLLFREGYSRKK